MSVAICRSVSLLLCSLVLHLHATMDGPLHTMADREPDLDTPEERDKFYQEVCIAVLQSLKK